MSKNFTQAGHPPVLPTLFRLLRNQTIILVLLAYSFGANAQGPGSQIPKTTPLINGGTCAFLQFTPWDSTVHAGTKHPLIIFLHGAGEKALNPSLTTVGRVAVNAEPHLCASGATMGFTVGGVYSTFYVLSPQLDTSQGTWPSNYVQTMINYAKAHLNIDTNRIYLTGLSLGGGGCWKFAMDSTTAQTNQIAALAPMSATDDGNDNNICSVLFNSKLPIWNFADDGDPTVSANNSESVQLKIGIPCAYTPAGKWTYYHDHTHENAWIQGSDTGHHTYTLSSSYPSTVGTGSYTQNPNVYEWFLSNTRATTTNNPPTAHTNAAQVIYTPTSSVTLSGSGTPVSPATTISSYAWTFLSGPVTPSIASSSGTSTSVTGLDSAGFYLFRLTVTDNNGLTGSALDSVLVNDGHPLVNAGSNQSITLPVSSVSLSGSASGVGGHTISTTSWTKTSGPSGGTITSPSSLSTTVTGLVQGTYIFQLSATDNQALTSTSQVTITVNAAASGGSGALGYLVAVGAPLGNCGDTSSSGRFPVYGDSLVNSGKLYADSARTSVYDWAFNWFEFSATLNGPILHDLQVYPDGSVHALLNCPGVTSRPPNGNVALGYIKVTNGPGGNCGDTSSNGKTAIYGDSLANNVILSPDPQRTNPLDGGYNSFGFSTAPGDPITYTFSGYADGSLHALTACPTGQKDKPVPISGAGASLNTEAGADHELGIYPNPTRDQVNIHLPGVATGPVTILVRNSTGAIVLSLVSSKTGNLFDQPVSLSGLPAGLYVIEVRIGEKTEGRKKIVKL